MKTAGMVYLVGAGPGDPGLLTLRGAELLRQADVVIYDGLVNPSLLRGTRADAEIIAGGKHDRTRCVSQETLNALLVDQARRGRCVVRLKGGDPISSVAAVRRPKRWPPPACRSRWSPASPRCTPSPLMPASR